MNIELSGWTHVHTYQENHGDHDTAIYQRTPVFAGFAFGRRVELLNVTKYRDGRPTHISTDSGPHANDYLLARDISGVATIVKA